MEILTPGSSRPQSNCKAPRLPLRKCASEVGRSWVQRPAEQPLTSDLPNTGMTLPSADSVETQPKSVSLKHMSQAGTCSSLNKASWKQWVPQGNTGETLIISCGLKKCQPMNSLENMFYYKWISEKRNSGLLLNGTDAVFQLEVDCCDTFDFTM